MSLKCSAEARSRVPERKNAVKHLMQKVCVLDKPHSGPSYSSADHEFKVS